MCRKVFGASLDIVFQSNGDILQGANMMGVYCCAPWGRVWLTLLCVGRFVQAASLPAGCPVTLQPGQVSSIAKSCSNVTSGNQYNCCASALVELRILLAEAPPMSTTFSISERQGAACLKGLDSALIAHDTHTNFQTMCNIAPGDIFHASTRGCHGISSVEKIHEVLREQRVDFHLIQESCTEASTLCERCRRAVLDATYVVASTGGSSGMKANVLQCCSDLVFLALASNCTQARASEIGACLYIAPDTPVIDIQPTSPSESPVPSIPNTDVVPSRVLTRSIVVLATCIALTSLALFFLIMLVIIVFRKRKLVLCPQEEMPLTGCKLKRMNSTNCRRDCASLYRHFKFLEIQRATDNFSTIIGRGGFGTVYKARFKDGLVAAVKRMNKGTSQGEQEFCKEMELLGRLHHRHLVTLRGYCADRCHERLLVYEYCENGSLKEHLHGSHREPGQVKPALSWRKRLQIALDVATGLVRMCRKINGHCVIFQLLDNSLIEKLFNAYLPVKVYCLDHRRNIFIHFVSRPCVTVTSSQAISCSAKIYCEGIPSTSDSILLHRNKTIFVHSNNISIADFGLAHAGRSDDANFEPVTTEVHGTPGYMDPEYAQTQELTEKSDVYSFGVLLLELVTGRRAINDDICLVDWAQKYMDNVESKTAFLVDSELERHEYNLEELKSVISIIKQCTQINGKLRPKMRQIVRLLYDIPAHTTMDSSSRSSHSSGNLIPLGNCIGIDTNYSI